MIKSFIMAHTKAVILAAACAVAAAIAIPTGIHVYSANHNAPEETVTAKKDTKSEEKQDRKQEKKVDKKSSDAEDSAEQADAENADAASSETASAEQKEQDKTSASAKNATGASKAGTASNGKTQSSAQTSQPAAQQAQPAAQNTTPAASVPATPPASAQSETQTLYNPDFYPLAQNEWPNAVVTNATAYLNEKVPGHPITAIYKDKGTDPYGNPYVHYWVSSDTKIPFTNNNSTFLVSALGYSEEGALQGATP